MQSAQRLAHIRLEEIADKSMGDVWFCHIDKMDEQRAVCPSEWPMLTTPLFKLGARLTVGLVGSLWYGCDVVKHHIRTVYDDCRHGADMQASILTKNFHDAATGAQRIPSKWFIGADNTPKETKNRTILWWACWMLAIIAPTSLSIIGLWFLIVGHTHNDLDRFFSRLGVALMGRNYYTRDDLRPAGHSNT